MQVFQTDGPPPSLGRIILPIMGCSTKRSAAATKVVNVKSITSIVNAP
jgi:hypothetical protein